MAPKKAKHHASIVFRGTVAEFRVATNGDRMAIFQVNRVWKGDVTEHFEMLALEGDACFDFPYSLLRVGNELLVYASRFPDRAYFPMPCNTKFARNSNDMREIGPGRKPHSK